MEGVGGVKRGIDSLPADVLWGFVCHAFISPHPPYPQRTSAGRLGYRGSRYVCGKREFSSFEGRDSAFK